MGRKIPPFAALRAFEALSRRGSLQAAGQELGISAGAVSHQLKSLEDHLGVKLLLRSHNRLVITEAGSRFAAELSEGLDLLELASLHASSARETARISISLFQSLAELWIVPLLGAFNRDHPHVLVSLVTAETADISNSDVDLAIRYADLPPPSYHSMELFLETIGPLASPDYLAANGSLDDPSEIVGHRLIYCTCEPNEWRFWTEHSGVSFKEAQNWLEVDTRAAAIHAGEQGLGVVMGRRPFADLALARGSLVQLFDASIPTGMRYFIIAPGRTWSSRRVRDFSSWLQSVARADNPFRPAKTTAVSAAEVI